jgi:RNA polymerase sigma-70 factor, ECF subfamily
VDADETLSIDGEQAIESNILAGQVLKEISRLPETQREAVLLVYAGALGIPIGTVMSRLATARSALANLK